MVVIDDRLMHICCVAMPNSDANMACRQDRQCQCDMMNMWSCYRLIRVVLK